MPSLFSQEKMYALIIPVAIRWKSNPNIQIIMLIWNEENSIFFVKLGLREFHIFHKILIFFLCICRLQIQPICLNQHKEIRRDN
jgi:hypothetical protein